MGKKATTKTEIKRTCNRCGAERYVSLEDARTKIAGCKHDEMGHARVHIRLQEPAWNLRFAQDGA